MNTELLEKTKTETRSEERKDKVITEDVDAHDFDDGGECIVCGRKDCHFAWRKYR